MEGTQLDFYYSTSTTLEERLKEKVKAGSQTIDVWELMKDGKKRTTIMIRSELQTKHGKKYNLNSVRRATTDLMKKFELITKLEEVQFEPESGGNNHFYKSINRHGKSNSITSTGESQN